MVEIYEYNNWYNGNQVPKYEENNYGMAYATNESLDFNTRAKNFVSRMFYEMQKEYGENFAFSFHVAIDVNTSTVLRVCCSIISYSLKSSEETIEEAIERIESKIMDTFTKICGYYNLKHICGINFYNGDGEADSWVDCKTARALALDIIEAGYADKCSVALSMSDKLDPIYNINCYNTEYEDMEFINEFVKDWLNVRGYYHNKNKNECESNQEAKEADYKWHDLRKDSEDLPESGRNVIACYELDGEKGYEVTRFVKDDRGLRWWINCEYLKVIAWKYFEIGEFVEE